MSIEQRHAAYKQKQVDDERAAQQAKEDREVQKLKEAHEWLQEVLAERFPTEKFQTRERIAIAGTNERIYPVHSLQFQGRGWFFYSKEKGSLSLYTPALGSGGCNHVTDFGPNFTEKDFFDAVDSYLVRME